MSDLVWLAESEMAEWDAFVANHPLGLVYHTSAWCRTLVHGFPHITGHFPALREERTGRIVAGLPAYVVRSWLLGNRVVSVPFASISDPLLSTAGDMDLLWPALCSLHHDARARKIEVRAVKSASLLQLPGAEAQPAFLHHYLPLAADPEELQKTFARKSIRHALVRAVRNGVQVRRETGPDAVDKFYPHNLAARRRLGLPPLPLRFFTAMAEFCSRQFTVLTACKNDRVLGGLVALHFNGMLHIEYTGASDESDQLGAGKLLFWEAIRYAWELDCKAVSFGRTAAANSGLVAFKKRWGAIEEPIWIYGNSATYHAAAGNGAIRWAFSHMSPAIAQSLGAFIYRHHG
jgi:hypothetical protein